MNIILLESLSPEGVIPATDRRSHHIISVLRLRPGDTCLVGELNGHRGTATITSIEDGAVHYRYEVESYSSPLFPVTLLVGQVRPISMKRILREATMLGVKKILICRAELAEKSYESAKIYTEGLYEEYLLDGAMISGDVSIPEVEIVTDMKKLDFSTFTHRLLLDNVLPSVPLSSLTLEGEVLVAIGPERGFSDAEREFFLSRQFTVHSIGSRILRTETACPVAVSIVLSRMNLL